MPRIKPTLASILVLLAAMGCQRSASFGGGEAYPGDLWKLR